MIPHTETIVSRVLDGLDDVAAAVGAMISPLRIFLVQLVFFLVVCGGLALAIGGLVLAFVAATN
jgi:hypothetical protein